MKSGFSPVGKEKPKSRKAFSWSLFIFTAVLFIFVGMLITANFDLNPSSVAQIPTNISQTGMFPVVEGSDGELESPFVKVVDKLQNAVVNISARSKQEALPWWHQQADFATSSGSGFFFRDDGFILTNNHVVQDADKLMVTTATGYKYDAIMVGADPQTDLAVLKIEPEEDITAIAFGNSDEIKVGDWAIAIGNPFPQQGLDRTVTVGVISAKGRSNLRFNSDTPLYQDYIQTDASINPGNSGGPLLNLRGECVGVNAAISSPTGVSVGIGFAIPINLARSVVPDLIATGKVTRGWLGIWLGNLTEDEARRQGLESVHGVKIDSVFQQSPAASAGIKNGDIITKINGQEVSNNGQLTVLISQAREGQKVPMEIVRNGERFTVEPVIGDRDKFLAEAQGTPTGNSNIPSVRWMGMELVTFNDDIAQSLGIEHFEGVYVQGVTAGSPADRSSITRGTIILQINNQSVKSVEDVYRVSSEIGRTAARIPMIVVESDGTIARKVIRP